MSGIQEILVIVIVLLLVLVVPRITGRGAKAQAGLPLFFTSSRFLSGTMRLAIVISVLWPLLAAAYFQPWQNEALLFVYVGTGPVVAGWSAYWILSGYRKKR